MAIASADVLREGVAEGTCESTCDPERVEDKEAVDLALPLCDAWGMVRLGVRVDVLVCGTVGDCDALTDGDPVMLGLWLAERVALAVCEALRVCDAVRLGVGAAEAVIEPLCVGVGSCEGVHVVLCVVLCACELVMLGAALGVPEALGVEGPLPVGKLLCVPLGEAVRR